MSDKHKGGRYQRKDRYYATKAGIAEKRGHCASWLSGLCNGKEMCTCVPYKPAKK